MPQPPFPTGSVPGVSHAPFHDRSWTDSPVVLRGFPDVPSPSVERVCPRCDPNTSGPDAAYPEPIITASAPLVCQLSWRAGASDQSANPLSGSGRDSQSALRFAVSDQLKSPAAPLTNRMCPACRWTLIWLRCGTQARDNKNNKKKKTTIFSFKSKCSHRSRSYLYNYTKLLCGLKPIRFFIHSTTIRSFQSKTSNLEF